MGEEEGVKEGRRHSERERTQVNDFDTVHSLALCNTLKADGRASEVQDNMCRMANTRMKHVFTKREHRRVNDVQDSILFAIRIVERKHELTYLSGMPCAGQYRASICIHKSFHEV